MRRYLIFFTASLPTLIYSISATTVAVAFPDIITDLNTSVVVAGWTISAFQLTWVAIVPVTGKITEALGQRTVLLTSALLFTIGSGLCAIAPNIYLLIAARVVQAVGGAAFMPCATAIISDTFPESRQRAIGLISSIFPIGMVIGPNLGGWLVESFGWRSVFWVNIPFGVIVLVLAWLLLKGDINRQKQKIDFLGAGVLALSVLAFMLGLTVLSEPGSGMSGLFAALLFAIGIVIMFLFIRRERRASEPVLDLVLFKQRPFVATNIYNFVYGAGAIGVINLIPLFAVSVYGMSTFESGLILTPRSIATIIVSAIASFSLMRWGYRKPIALGTVAMAASLFLLAIEPHGVQIGGLEVGATPVLLVILLLSGIGIGAVSPSSNNACIELMPDRVATITSVRILFRQTGSMLGILLSTVVLHMIADDGRAFQLLFLGWGAIMVLSIAAVFFIPSGPSWSPRTGSKRGTD